MNRKFKLVQIISELVSRLNDLLNRPVVYRKQDLESAGVGAAEASDTNIAAVCEECERRNSAFQEFSISLVAGEPAYHGTSISSDTEDDQFFTVPVGQLTFDLEGHEGGDYHSRTPHVPSTWSGVTIGRGYDMSSRAGDEIVTDLTQAGVDSVDAEKFRGAAYLRGEAAEKFLTDNKLEEFEISKREQSELFNQTFARKTSEAERIFNRQENHDAYGYAEWDKLNPAIRDTILDLTYHGNNVPETRRIIMKSARANNLTEFLRDVNNMHDAIQRAEVRNPAGQLISVDDERRIQREAYLTRQIELQRQD